MINALNITENAVILGKCSHFNGTLLLLFSIGVNFERTRRYCVSRRNSFLSVEVGRKILRNRLN